MLVNIEDKSKIKKVNFKFPTLMSTDAEEQVKELYRTIQQIEDKLDAERTSVRELEGTLKRLKEDFNVMNNSIFSIEFEEKEIEHVDKIVTNMAVINPTDASNRNYTGQ